MHQNGSAPSGALFPSGTRPAPDIRCARRLRAAGKGRELPSFQRAGGNLREARAEIAVGRYPQVSSSSAAGQRNRVEAGKNVPGNLSILDDGLAALAFALVFASPFVVLHLT